MGSPPTTNRVGGLIRKIEKPFKLWSCSLVHFYNSKVFNRGGKRKTGGEPPERILVSFHSFVWLGENQNLKLNFVWNRKFPDWNRPKWWKMADSFVVLYGNGVPKKSRAQKMSGGAAGGGAAQTRIATKRGRRSRTSEELAQYGFNF